MSIEAINAVFGLVILFLGGMIAGATLLATIQVLMCGWWQQTNVPDPDRNPYQEVPHVQ